MVLLRAIVTLFDFFLHPIMRHLSAAILGKFRASDSCGPRPKQGSLSDIMSVLVASAHYRGTPEAPSSWVSSTEARLWRPC